MNRDLYADLREAVARNAAERIVGEAVARDAAARIAASLHERIAADLATTDGGCH